jgi:uncharacterized protein
VRITNPPQMYPRVRNQGYRVDSWPEGGFPGSDFDLMREQLLDEHKVDYGILIPLHGHSFGAEAPDYAGALCHAVNEWVREAILDRDERLHSTITSTVRDAADASCMLTLPSGSGPLDGAVRIANDYALGAPLPEATFGFRMRQGVCQR